MSAGRHRVLDESKCREICALITVGCSIQAAARYVGCSRNTIRREAARNEEFADLLRYAEIEARIRPVRTMQEASGTHWRAAAWLLERTQPEEYARAAANLVKIETVQDFVARATRGHRRRTLRFAREPGRRPPAHTCDRLDVRRADRRGTHQPRSKTAPQSDRSDVDAPGSRRARQPRPAPKWRAGSKMRANFGPAVLRMPRKNRLSMNARCSNFIPFWCKKIGALETDHWAPEVVGDSPAMRASEMSLCLPLLPHRRRGRRPPPAPSN